MRLRCVLGQACPLRKRHTKIIKIVNKLTFFCHSRQNMGDSPSCLLKMAFISCFPHPSPHHSPLHQHHHLPFYDYLKSSGGLFRAPCVDWVATRPGGYWLLRSAIAATFSGSWRQLGRKCFDLIAESLCTCSESPEVRSKRRLQRASCSFGGISASLD